MDLAAFFSLIASDKSNTAYSTSLVTCCCTSSRVISPKETSFFVSEDMRDISLRQYSARSAAAPFATDAPQDAAKSFIHFTQNDKSGFEQSIFSAFTPSKQPL